MAGVVHIPWYATLFRGDDLAAGVSQVAALSLRYGATKYQVHRSMDDQYKILQMVWFETKRDWYRYWDGPEMVAFRQRMAGRYQVLLTYVWHEELACGELGPEVPLPESSPAAPEPTPTTAV
jgi:hypothetical protein